MSGDALCVGVCMIDWDSGVCLGCGRTADEINGVPVPTARDGRPEVRRDESAGVTLNSVLRSKRMSDPEYTQYLAGELFAGFASLH